VNKLYRIAKSLLDLSKDNKLPGFDLSSFPLSVTQGGPGTKMRPGEPGHVDNQGDGKSGKPTRTRKRQKRKPLKDVAYKLRTLARN